MRWKNWAESVTLDPRKIYRPASLPELQSAVKDAKEHGYQIRTVGSGHAWSQLGLGDSGAILETDRLDKPLSNNNDGTVTVQGGITIVELNKWLYENDLALPNMGDTDRQAIAGAVATDTHGSGAGFGSLSELVRGMSVVLADGELRELDDAELRAGRVSLGRLGVVYSLTLDVVPKYFLRHERRVVKLREEKEHLEQLIEDNRNIEYWLYPLTPYAERLIRNEIPSANEQLFRYYFRNIVSRLGARLSVWKGRNRPESLPEWFNSQIPNLGPDVREGPAHRILPLVANTTVDSIKTLTMEYQFSLSKFWEAFDLLEESFEVAREKGVYICLPVHIRFTKKSSKSILSHHVHDPTVSFSCNFSPTYAGAHTWLPYLERGLLELGARAHWGKIYYTEPAIADGFEDIRQRLDPTSVFNAKQPPYTPADDAF